MNRTGGTTIAQFLEVGGAESLEVARAKRLNEALKRQQDALCRVAPGWVPA